MNNIKAIPTQYKGILFDSKSEAIFARSLDVWNKKQNGYGKLTWQYHPEKFQIDRYCPDFSCAPIISQCHALDANLKIRLIEYKPSRPTSAYINRIANYFNEIKNSDHFNIIYHYMIICYGNTFEETPLRKILICHKKTKRTHIIDSRLSDDLTPEFNTECLSEAKKYRFDLEHQQI